MIMENDSVLEKSKVISLYVNEIEEYEVDNDNIGELLVTSWNHDISKQCNVIFNLSKEALIGFGQYSIRLANTFEENYHCHIDPLGGVSSSQGMGFFLTPQSSELIIGCKSHGNLESYGIEKKNNIIKRHKNYNNLKINYIVDLAFDNDYFECHNIGFNNVAEIRVLKDGENISQTCRLTLMLSRNGLLGLGTELLRLANNYSKNKSLIIWPIEENKLNCELGFFLTTNSASLSVGCEDFQNVFYYDNKFGTR